MKNAATWFLQFQEQLSFSFELAQLKGKLWLNSVISDLSRKISLVLLIADWPKEDE